MSSSFSSERLSSLRSRWRPWHSTRAFVSGSIVAIAVLGVLAAVAHIPRRRCSTRRSTERQHDDPHRCDGRVSAGSSLPRRGTRRCDRGTGLHPGPKPRVTPSSLSTLRRWLGAPCRLHRLLGGRFTVGAVASDCSLPVQRWAPGGLLPASLALLSIPVASRRGDRYRAMLPQLLVARSARLPFCSCWAGSRLGVPAPRCSGSAGASGSDLRRPTHVRELP